MLSVRAADLMESKVREEAQNNAQRQIIDEALRKAKLRKDANGKPIEEVHVEGIELENLTQTIKEEIELAGYTIKPYMIMEGFTLVVKKST